MEDASQWVTGTSVLWLKALRLFDPLEAVAGFLLSY